MLVFMVRGLFTPLEFPYAQFATKDLTGELIFDPFWSVVYRLERIGLKVISATADGASPNRSFFKMNLPTTSKSLASTSASSSTTSASTSIDIYTSISAATTSADSLFVSSPLASFEYKCKNPFTLEDRCIYFFSDPPHLLKTIRNCLASSKRQLWFDGEEISWKHLISLYYRGSGKCPISLAHKIKYEHVFLTSFSKMRVDLAAQAMSGTVANALKINGGPKAQKTAKFIELVNKFFDVLNVNSFDEGKRTRNVFKDPIRPGDHRLKWLQDEFISFLNKWEESVRNRNGNFSQAERNKMLLSTETLLGIKFTIIKSFIDMTKWLFTNTAVKSFLSEKISQDPLEKFFGVQRQRGRVNENPSVKEFCSNTQTLQASDQHFLLRGAQGKYWKKSQKSQCSGLSTIGQKEEAK